MGKDRSLPTRVFAHGARYYFVRAQGRKRIWVPLCKIKDGLPAMYAALAQLLSDDLPDSRMPAVIAAWQRDVMPRHTPKTQRDEIAMCRTLPDAFAELKAVDVQAPDIAAFLVGGLYGDDGRRTPSGRMLAALIAVAYLTGQRIGDLLDLRWTADLDDLDAPHVTDEGLRFRPSKTRGKTGAALIIEWTPRLRDAVDRLRKLQAERLIKRRAAQRTVSGWLFTTQSGTPITYSGPTRKQRKGCRPPEPWAPTAQKPDQRLRTPSHSAKNEGHPLAVSTSVSNVPQN